MQYIEDEDDIGNMDNLFSKIIKIASILDANGFYKQSDFLENQLMKYAKPAPPLVRPRIPTGPIELPPPRRTPIPDRPPFNPSTAPNRKPGTLEPARPTPVPDPVPTPPREPIIKPVPELIPEKPILTLDMPLYFKHFAKIE
jgi:hypothetical protein